MRRVLLLVLAMAAAAAVAQVDVAGQLGGRPAPGFARATAPRPLSFPADHGPHSDFRSEWWYFTGNLTATNGRHFGFQLTFFRVALVPDEVRRPSAWATDQAWMAHFSLTDSQAGRFHASERLAREALGIAGARATPFRVWVDDWNAASAAPAALLPLRLSASHDDVAIELELSETKPLVLQGLQGWDRKGPEPGNASYYYAYTRLAAKGSVHTRDAKFTVTGTAWMDREWSTSALGADLAGWDWISLQLSNGSDLMLYRLRRKDGGVDEFSKGALILPSGARIALSAHQFEFEPGRWWTSPTSGVRYPVAWSIEIPSLEMSLDVAPRLDDQELDLSVRYWEGAVHARGRADAAPVGGEGYLELAGY